VIRRVAVANFLHLPAVLMREFVSPCVQLRTEESEILFRRKTLGVRRSNNNSLPGAYVRPSSQSPSKDIDLEDDLEEESHEEGIAVVETKKVEPLVLWEGEDPNTGTARRIEVDPVLCEFLRPHQREGVQFSFDCVMGLKDFEGHGVILADDMGLGKTIQAIALLYTLLKQGFDGKPTCRRAIVICPTSLVRNWEEEVVKWLNTDPSKPRVHNICAVSETKREDVERKIDMFAMKGVINARTPHAILIISYETFRLHLNRITGV
jgi:DNA repair and recombination RAD54-like protein